MSSRLLTGVSWVMVANVVYLVSSVVLTLILPRFISPVEFGFWQLYQLFVLYLGYATFGYSDGLNLRLAGRFFRQISVRQISSGLFYVAVLDAILFFGLVTAFALIAPGDAQTLFVWATVGAVFYVQRAVMSFVFQSTGAVRAYAIAMIAERLLLVVGVFVVLSLGEASATSLVIADVASKAVAFVVALVLGRSVFVSLPSLKRSVMTVFLRDCRHGMYILLANATAMFIQGGVRLVIIDAWDIVTFGQVSLALQFASLFMVAVNSIAITVLPNLKRIDRSEYPSAYRLMRRRMVGPLVLSLAIAFPIATALAWWLPDYALAVNFMMLLFPICIYESLNRGLTAVFMKAMRMERALLWINALALLVALSAATVGAYIIHSLEVTALAVVLALATRALLSEVFVSKRLRFSTAADWVLETIVVVTFLVTVLLGSQWWAVVILLAMLVGYSLHLGRAEMKSQRLSAAPKKES